MNFLANRRRVLLGLAASATAAATGTAQARQTAEEAPELIALGNALPALGEAVTAARDDLRRIYDEAMKEWPQAPEEIIHFGAGSRAERDIAGAGIMRAFRNGEQVCNYGTPETYEASIQYHSAEVERRSKFKSRRGLKFHQIWLERDRQALPLSRAYCAEIQRITEASGYQPARDHLTRVTGELRECVGAIMAAEVRTMAGVVIKAEALATWGKAEPFRVQLNPDGAAWADNLARSIMKFAGTA